MFFCLRGGPLHAQGIRGTSENGKAATVNILFPVNTTFVESLKTYSAK